MSNTKTVLLVRTRLSGLDPTQISYSWAEAVKQRFGANGWQVIDLVVDDAVRSKVENLLQGCESSVFLFYGHGLPSQMVGQDGTAMIDLDNLHLLKDQTVCVIACWTAKELGPAAANITRCYLGYDDEISVGFGPYSDYVEKCVNKGILAMLDTSSCTIGHARQLIIDEYNHWIDYFMFGVGASGFQSAGFAADLVMNRDALAQVYGDGTATI